MQDFVTPILQLFETLPDIAVAVIVIFWVINMIAWVFLPFAVFGIKAKMNESRKIQEKILKVMMGD